VAGSAFRWRLAGIELWRGPDLLATLSCDALRHLIEHHLATAALQAEIQSELLAHQPLAKAPARGQPSAAVRAQLRTQRRRRAR
jgi:hypothetical protein